MSKISSYRIEIQLNGSKESVIVLAESKYHAIEMLMYKHGWHEKQPDRTKYKPIK